MSYQKTYEKLLEFRKKEELDLPLPKILKSEFEDFKGDIVPLSIRNYQKIGSLHMVLMPRFVLGDDAGLGKTAQIILSLSLLWQKEIFKTIVVTNKSLVGQWEEEIKRFTRDGEIDVFTCSGSPTKRVKVYQAFQESTKPSVLIVGYASVRQDYFDHMQTWEGFTLVLDECTCIKSPTARISRIMHDFSRHAKRCWGLTATLIKRDLRDGWGIFSVVYPGFFAETTEASFMKEWCVTKEIETPMKGGGRLKKRVIVGYKKEKLLAFKKKIDPFFLSRSKKDVAKELPNLIVTQIFVDMNKAQRAKYDEALEGLLTIDATGEEKETTLLSSLIYCQQIVDHPSLIECEGESAKLDTLLDLLENSELAQQKVIVFSRFKKMINLIESELNKKNIPNVRITGDESGAQRTASKTEFSNSKSDTKIILINEAGKEGVNLQAAQAIIFYDTPWTGGDYIQLVGRMIRIGSVHERVQAIHLVCKNSIDQRVLQKLSNSMEVIEEVIGERIKGNDGFGLFDEKIDAGDLFELVLKDRKWKG